jgi:transglutaminase-like putative cysteine protease
MDKSKFLLVLALAALTAGCAVKGKAIIEQYKDVTPTRFEGAVAVVLEDRETAKVFGKGDEFVVEGFRRIKLLDRRALDCGENAPNCRLTQAICYKEGFEELEMIEARTITPDGEVIEIDKDDMTDRTWTTWNFPEEDQRCWVWQMKGAAPGSIFEIRSRSRWTRVLSVGGLWFADRDPVLEVSYTLDAPADYAYRWKAYHIDLQPTEKKDGDRIVRTWTARDVAPIQLEDGMIAPDDVTPKLMIANERISAFMKFSEKCGSIKSWEDLGHCKAAMYKEQQKVTPEVKEVAAKIAKTAKTETEKVKAVWKWMNENIRYVGLEKGLGGWVPLSAHVVCTKKYGDCKAVGGLIAVLCRELGLKADPIAIGTRLQLGQLDLELPWVFHFNHVIARVEADGKVYWLDATYRNTDYKTTPYNDQGVNVIVVRPGAPFVDFVPVQPPESNTGEGHMVFTPDGNGDVIADFTYSTTGNIAGTFRRYSHEYLGEKWNRWIESWAADSYTQLTVLEQSFEGKEDNDKPFVIKIKAKIKKALQPTGKGVSMEIKPFLIPTTMTYFQLPKRRYAMEMSYKSAKKYRYEVVIPEGMEPVGLPKNVTMSNDYVELERLSQIENDRVVTEIRTKIKFLKIQPDKYPEARKMFQKFWDDTTYVLMFEPKEKKSS